MAVTWPPDPPAAPLPQLILTEGLQAADVDADKIVEQWLASLEDRFKRKDFSNLTDLFIDDCWWRDFVALSWDTRTLHGHGLLSEYLTSAKTELSKLNTIKPGGLQPALLDMGGLIWVQAGFSFETKFGSGQGVVRLANVSKNEWKAWMVFTQLQNLQGQGQPDWNIRSDGTPASAAPHATNATTTNGTNGDSSSCKPDFQVIVVGAGQGGLGLAAHLKNLGISYLVVDKGVRVGDSWRQRYQTITSHTPTYTDHYPFLRFPDNYPKWLNQEKLTNWQEGYATIMELNLLLSTTVTHIAHDASARRYSIDVRTNAATTTKTLTSTHLVLATGMFGLDPKTPTFASQSTFPGTVYHSKFHRAATSIPNVHDKKIVLIGAGTSAHDIAQDYVNAGAKAVSMVQRHAIFSVSRAATETHAVGMWDSAKSGLSTAEADLLGNSIPFQVVRTMGVGMSMMMSAQDKEMLDKLTARGMKIKRGETGEGLVDHQFLQGGHFYVDQGAWEMIADGRIEVLQCEGGVVDVGAEGVRLADGKVVEADVVVLCTGFERNYVTVQKMMGEDVLKRVGALGLLDAEGERIGWWRPTPIPGFWYMTGSFIWCRQFSALLALQIQAIEQGLNEEHWRI
ncbi:uncharacterized protein HMPREF1541_07152 [Cyphellophora europaea CBS 101466]|uniref:FAD/NAD(P)-binding domain-containing protein n=1 Tax=Cyphellophora europaea (strain CBS 101466) TaxID=1220924 RepID=W2RMI2_CYPE1|nr:uncharacterized protein HMPREF1541_07152 [Cyphellophora europaea CBS 101466]ETN37530.1 hypothetical protein HMPREF1541_07152 [Cyphellophora europaea CBS 101466]